MRSLLSAILHDTLCFFECGGYKTIFTPRVTEDTLGETEFAACFFAIGARRGEGFILIGKQESCFLCLAA
ncbi:MAG: hypothetical protein BGP08_15560 [Rhizobiales bacterium 64-17]|nr:MAG: hypothetical protein BGP08_15560 [Rhizobiales bacterium 64-17]